VAIKRFPEDKSSNRKPVLLANPSAEEIINSRDLLVGIGKKTDFEKISRI
jgi:K+/H+ antiporter YhaU regulatory subunit KhtT